MSSDEVYQKELSEKISRIVSYDVSEDEVIDVYESWSEKYDKDVSLVDYQAPARGAEVVAKHVTSTDTRILDVAAGTGLVGEQLQKRGFTSIDAVDGSQHMLDRAQEKGIYKNLICSMLGKGHTLPIENDVYGGVVAVGCFTPGHLNGECYPELIRVTKPGGVVMLLLYEKYFARPRYVEEVEAPLYRLAREGLWTLVTTDHLTPFVGEESGRAIVLRVN